ncbi:hypothetical protein BU17DRAFT_65047 [Hysterangium stoloniferum]|nr:hypothetical protein BU17DRAFT_65047 [Hysterangium stoloniferum]
MDEQYEPADGSAIVIFLDFLRPFGRYKPLDVARESTNATSCITSYLCNPVVNWDHWRSHELTGPRCIVQNKNRIQADAAYEPRNSGGSVDDFMPLPLRGGVKLASYCHLWVSPSYDAPVSIGQTEPPLNTNFDDVASTFIMQIARNLSTFDGQDTLLIGPDIHISQAIIIPGPFLNRTVTTSVGILEPV